VSKLCTSVDVARAAARPQAGVARDQARVARAALLVLGLLTVAASAPAWAQSAQMNLSTVTRERGLHSGEFVLHPSLQVMGHYDTNLFNGNDVVAGNPPVGATSVRLMPRLMLQNDLTGNTTFRFSSGADARLYLAGDNDWTSKAISKQGGVGANVGLDFTYGNNRPIAFTVFDHFTRQLRSSLFETTTTLHRNNNDVGARIDFHPGDNPLRRPFNVSLMGAYATDRFDDFQAGNANTLRTRLTASWRFLPKTAATLDTSWDFRSLTNDLLLQQRLSYNSQPFRAKLGLAGALTKRVTFEVAGGWGLSQHEKEMEKKGAECRSLSAEGVPVATPGECEFNSFIASAALGFKPAESTRITLGYGRDFRDSFIGNYSEFHRGYLTLQQRFGAVMDVRGEFGFGRTRYGAWYPQNAKGELNPNITAGVGGGDTNHRTELPMDASLIANFEMARLVGLEVGYRLRKVITDYRVQTIVADRDVVLSAGAYTANELFASLTLRY
jgi:hypothetical protein